MVAQDMLKWILQVGGEGQADAFHDLVDLAEVPAPASAAGFR